MIKNSHFLRLLDLSTLHQPPHQLSLIRQLVSRTYCCWRWGSEKGISAGLAFGAAVFGEEVAPRERLHFCEMIWFAGIYARLENEATHFARTQQKLLREWHAFHGQPCASGDDMNIIQVGRPAVSRYHRNRKYFRGGKGIDNDVHDFPNARYGLKLGGFMLLTPVSNVEPSSDSRADSSSCSGLQAEAAEAGPREQAPIHMTDE